MFGNDYNDPLSLLQMLYAHSHSLMASLQITKFYSLKHQSVSVYLLVQDFSE